MKTMLSNLKRLLRKRNNGGFTLIEVVIAMALLGVLVTGVMMFMSPIITMVQNNKKNARATLLSEAINTYVMGNLSKAKIVTTFAGSNLDEVMSSGSATFDMVETIDLKIKFSPGNDYSLKNEIRCMGMVWLDDNSPTGAGRKKLMLVNCKVDQASLKILSYEPVFDDSMYSDLYPTLLVNDIYSEPDEDGNTKPLPSYEIVSKVYVSPDCYNTTRGIREATNPNFTGTTYVTPLGLELTPPPPQEGGIPFGQRTYPMGVTGTTENDLINASLNMWYDTTNGFTDGTSNFFYPDTFIYYVVEK